MRGRKRGGRERERDAKCKRQLELKRRKDRRSNAQLGSLRRIIKKVWQGKQAARLIGKSEVEYSCPQTSQTTGLCISGVLAWHSPGPIPRGLQLRRLSAV